MKRKFWWMLLPLLVSLFGCHRSQPVELRVLSYNIRHGEGMDHRVDLERIAAVIRSTNADLVALQEVDRGTARTDRVDQPARLAALTGMQAVFEKNIDFQGGEYGNAVLSRLPITTHRNHPLPKEHPGEQRGLLEVHVQANGHPLVFMATHFDYHPEDAERLASVDMLKSLLADQGNVPVIVTGDLNSSPDSAVIQHMSQFLRDVCGPATAAIPTFPADQPDVRIDYMFYTDQTNLRVIDYRVVEEPMASDHRPILARFVLP